MGTGLPAYPLAYVSDQHWICPDDRRRRFRRIPFSAELWYRGDELRVHSRRPPHFETDAELDIASTASQTAATIVFSAVHRTETQVAGSQVKGTLTRNCVPTSESHRSLHKMAFFRALRSSPAASMTAIQADRSPAVIRRLCAACTSTSAHVRFCPRLTAAMMLKSQVRWLSG